MLRPKSENLRGLQGRDTEDSSSWLLHGLRAYLFGTVDLLPRSPLAFPGAEGFLNETPSISDDLATVILALPDPDRESFCRACARCLGRLDLDQPDDVEVAENLLFLSGRIGAYQVLPVLSRLAANSRSVEGAERLLGTALSVINDLSNVAYDEVIDCIEYIVENWKPFPPRLTRAALIAMVKAEPDKLLQHLRALYEPMELYYGFGSDFERYAGRRRRLIADIADLVTSRRPWRETLRPDAPRLPEAVCRVDWWSFTIRTDPDPDMRKVRAWLSLPELDPPLYEEELDGRLAEDIPPPSPVEAESEPTRVSEDVAVIDAYLMVPA